MNNPINLIDLFGLDTLSSKAANFNWDRVKAGDYVDGTLVLPEGRVTGQKTASDPFFGNLFANYSTNYEYYGHSSPYREHFQKGGEMATWVVSGPMILEGLGELTLSAWALPRFGTWLKPNVIKSVADDAIKEVFSVNPSKFDYFFGRVVSGSEHNIARSAQNLKDLTTLGIKNENQLMKIFEQALESGTVVSTKTSQYGTTVMRSVNIGNQGSINVGFFYQGGNMSVTPSVSTIIPKIW